MWLSFQKLEMTDFMEEDAKFTSWTRETDIGPTTLKVKV